MSMSMCNLYDEDEGKAMMKMMMMMMMMMQMFCVQPPNKTSPETMNHKSFGVKDRRFDHVPWFWL